MTEDQRKVKNIFFLLFFGFSMQSQEREIKMRCKSGSKAAAADEADAVD